MVKFIYGVVSKYVILLSKFLLDVEDQTTFGMVAECRVKSIWGRNCVLEVKEHIERATQVNRGEGESWSDSS